MTRTSRFKQQGFIRSGDPTIASYSYTDISEGTGVQEFYGVKLSTGTATYDYLLVNNAGLYSADEGEENLNSCDIDFDVTFNLPKQVKGIAYVRVPIGLYAQSDTRTGYITATIIHYDGSTETTIGTTVQSESFSAGSTGTIFSAVVKIPLTETHFKAGDTLRVTITGAASGGSGSTSDSIFFSPVGSQYGNTWTDGDLNSTLSVFIPFKIDV